MTDIENKNLPRAKENTEKTLKRLEKIKSRLEKATEVFKKIGVGIPVFAGIVGMSLGGVVGGGFGVVVGASLSVPVATALMALPVVAENVTKFKISSLKKKINPSIPDLLNHQQQKTAGEERRYQKILKYKDATVSDINFAKQDMEAQKHQEDVFLILHKLTF